jgi:hypothetical protein
MLKPVFGKPPFKDALFLFFELEFPVFLPPGFAADHKYILGMGGPLPEHPDLVFIFKEKAEILVVIGKGVQGTALPLNQPCFQGFCMGQAPGNGMGVGQEIGIIKDPGIRQ